MLSIISKVLWGFTTILLIYSGIKYTFKLNFIQFKFIKIITSFLKKDKSKNITIKDSFLMTLGARIGVGSIAGIALAIYMGGIGTVFWIWLSTIIVVPNSFCETLMGIKYHQKENKNEYIGGPAYYIKEGLNNNKLSLLYAVIIIITYIFGFLPIQANTISKSINIITNINPLYIGVILSIITGLVIMKGLKGIVNITNKMVPIMGSTYLLISIIVIIGNYSTIINVFISIIKSAFNLKSELIGVLTTAIIGIQRGIFSNESGIGTCAITAATTDNNSKLVGFSQMLGVYFTSLVICTATAIIIITSNYTSLNISDVNGIEIAMYSFKYHLSSLGPLLLVIIIFLFAFSTIITGYYYGESNLKFINNKNKQTTLLKLITIIMIFLGSIMSSLFIWKLIDVLVALLAIINIYALLKLEKKIIKEYYNK
jgi:alanine or glycine:cation symporter, AGCS family